LPHKVNNGTAGFLEYIYDAAGNKLAKKLGNVVTYYCGSIVYKSDKTPEYILHPEGIALKSSTGFTYQYNLTDHLGNVRSVVAGTTVAQNTDYFPFGLAHTTANLDKNKYLYNGKELQNENIAGKSFNNLDYGARFYDPTIARWNVIDPLAEKYYGLSPFAYCANNPMKFIDPDGRDWKNTEDKEIAKQLQQQAASRDKSLTKQESRINTKINKVENNVRLTVEKQAQKIARQQGRLVDVQAQKAFLSYLSKGITQLDELETFYTFNTVSEGVIPTLGSQSDGTIIINNSGDLGNRVHETTHAIQHANGAMTFSPLGSDNVEFNSHPTGLEAVAYRVQYSISPGSMTRSDKGGLKSIFGITPTWVQGINANGYYPYTLDKYK